MSELLYVPDLSKGLCRRNPDLFVGPYRGGKSKIDGLLPREREAIETCNRCPVKVDCAAHYVPLYTQSPLEETVIIAGQIIKGVSNARNDAYRKRKRAKT